MKNRIFIYSLFLILNCANAYSQIFSITDIDTSSYPRVKANFSLFDEAGISISDVDVSDFNVLDLNLDVNASIEVDCYDLSEQPPLSIILVVDYSQSMLKPEGPDIRWNWVVEGVRSFISSTDFEEDIEIAIVGFSDDASIISDFSKDEQHLIDAIESVAADGGTSYTPPFLNDTAGLVSLMKSTPKENRRISIFLTDGQPNEEPQTQEIIKELQKNNIQVYSITLLDNMEESIREIADQSGGKSYEIWDKSALNSLYELIAFYTTNRQTCEISWLSPIGCSLESLERKTEITYLPANQKRIAYYTASDRSRPFLLNDDKIIDFGNPEPLGDTTRTINISAIYSDFQIDSLILNNAQYSIVDNITYPITLEQDSVLSIKVRFTQGAIRQIVDGLIYIDAQPCPGIQYLIAGKPDIQLFTPNGGDIFSICDTIKITWGNVNQEQEVDLYYSTDSLKTWIVIDSNVTGLSYDWLISNEKLVQNECDIVVSVVLRADEHVFWIEHFENAGNEIVSNMIFDNTNSHLLISGVYDSTFALKDSTNLTYGSNDCFILKVDKTGNIISDFVFGSEDQDSISCITSDKTDGSIYLTGITNNNLQIENELIDTLIDDIQYCYLIKLSSELEFQKVAFFGANQTYQKVETKGMSIDIIDNNIALKGFYNGRFVLSGKLFDSKSEFKPFEVTYSKNLELLYFKELDTLILAEIDFRLIDSDSINYTLFNFSDTLKIDDSSIVSENGNDFVIYKHINLDEKTDKSDSCSIVSSPNYDINYDTLRINDIAAGYTEDRTFENVIYNTSPLPLTLINYTLSGQDMSYFNTNLNAPVTIPPYDSLGISLSCFADDFREYTAKIDFEFDCANDTSISIIMNSNCEYENIDSIEIDLTMVNTQNDTIISNSFKNLNNIPITINPVVSGVNQSEFMLMNPGSRELQAQEVFTLVLKFVPLGLGERNAEINWNTNSACGEITSYLTGYGIETNFNADEIDWSYRRLLTINDSSTFIHNQNQFEIIIDSIKLMDNDNIFTIVKNYSGVTIPAEDSMEIEVSFSPKQEINYQNLIIIYINSFNFQVNVPIRGIGTIPKINADFICGNEVVPDSRSIANLSIISESNSMNLHIYDIELKSQNSAFSISSMNEFDINSIEDSSLSITFTPQTKGVQFDTLLIINDAAPGPSLFPRDTLVLPIECYALDWDNTLDVDLGNLYICEIDTIDIKIYNNSIESDLIISNVDIVSSNNELFELINTFPITITPDDSSLISILFRSNSAGVYTADISLLNDWDIELKTTTSALVDEINFALDNEFIKVEIENDTTINVSAGIPFVDKPIEQMSFLLTYNGRNMIIDTKAIQSKIAGWNWNIENFKNGSFTLSGFGKLEAQSNQEFLEIPFSLLLGDTTDSYISLKYGDIFCNSDDSLFCLILPEDLCVRDIRYISPYFTENAVLEPTPNPVEDIVNLDFYIPLETLVNIDVVNLYGDAVSKVFNSSLDQGRYDIQVNLSDLQSGVYFIVFDYLGTRISKKIIKL